MTSPQRQLNFDVFGDAKPVLPNELSEFRAPLFGSYVPAGFPSPAMDLREESLDLNELCIQNPSTTYYVRASGESMTGVGIHDGDVLVVDRSIRAVDGNIVVAALNGDFTVKVLRTSPELVLEPRNDAFSNIEIGSSDDFDVFGVVTFVIHSTF
ncbi:translesion error-prone DNA polymerase V autoproteolytic subunit [Arenicella xantha]|uniref:DNA polymerase V n=1 Tax=Arenicella xantha TaxID=644221 RepID=A0A395JMW4_9GAMM|nr:translesion error-prone DNA polymerase V autoproteolytic subunit [Arenicella xantha]RBP51157.1 DNA polymerase V [Arenicella xantha]